MIPALLWATVATDFIATSVLLLVIYLTLVWRGSVYDVLGALGSTFTQKLDARARFLGPSSISVSTSCSPSCTDLR